MSFNCYPIYSDGGEWIEMKACSSTTSLEYVGVANFFLHLLELTIMKPLER